MKRTEPQLIGDVIGGLVNKYGLDKPMENNRACLLWGETVGPGINRLTTRRLVRDDELHVWIDSGAVKNELMYQRQSILETINAQLKSHKLKALKIH